MPLLSITSSISVTEFIPLSQIKGFLWLSTIFTSSLVVFNETFNVSKFLLLIPIRESSKDKAFSASLVEWISTIVEIFSWLAAWYKSLANISSTADKIIKIQSAPKLFAKAIWNGSIKKSLQSIGIWNFFLYQQCILIFLKKNLLL